jgi:hypothetical protein
MQSHRAAIAAARTITTSSPTEPRIARRTICRDQARHRKPASGTQEFDRCKSSGSLAMFAAIRRASSRVNSFGVTEFWEHSILGFAYLNMLA